MTAIQFLYKYDGVIEAALGFALIFIFDIIIRRTHSGKNLTAVLRCFLCTVMTYGVTVIREIIQFLTDYYNEDSALQDYNYVPAEDMLFFELFGTGSAQTGQYHVMDTDLDFICMALGCALGGGLLLLLSIKKQKRQNEKAKENEDKAETVRA